MDGILWQCQNHIVQDGHPPVLNLQIEVEVLRQRSADGQLRKIDSILLQLFEFVRVCLPELHVTSHDASFGKDDPELASRAEFDTIGIERGQIRASPQGEIGELHVLRLLYQDTLPQVAAVDAWCGPDDSHQDFIFGNRAIEVKSLSGRERSTVRISSEDQLESLADELFLLTQRLSSQPDAGQALSLNGIVGLIDSELADADAIEQFADKLAGMGYVPLAEYDAPRFIVGGLQGYRVTDGFPRLIRSELPPGITKVSYDVMLEAIAPFSCDEADMFRRP